MRVISPSQCSILVKRRTGAGEPILATGDARQRLFRPFHITRAAVDLRAEITDGRRAVWGVILG
jgi:hypothetical protein